MSASESHEMDKATNILDVWSLSSRQSESIATARCIRSGMSTLFKHTRSMCILVYLCLCPGANMRPQGQRIEVVSIVAVENPSLCHLDAISIENTRGSPFLGYHKTNSGSHPTISAMSPHLGEEKAGMVHEYLQRSKGYRR